MQRGTSPSYPDGSLKGNLFRPWKKPGERSAPDFPAYSRPGGGVRPDSGVARRQTLMCELTGAVDRNPSRLSYVLFPFPKNGTNFPQPASAFVRAAFVRLLQLSVTLCRLAPLFWLKAVGPVSCLPVRFCSALQEWPSSSARSGASVNSHRKEKTS